MPPVRAFCELHRIPFAVLQMNTVSGVLAGIHRIGRLTGHATTGQRCAERIRRELREIRARTATLPKPRVLLTLSRAPGEMGSIFTVARGSFMNELLEIAGAENVFHDISRPYPEVSKETIVKRAPEIILETMPDTRLTEAMRRRLLQDWQMFPGLPAVRSGRIYFLTDPSLQIPGPRLARAAYILAALCHPEAFASSPDASGAAPKAAARRANSAGVNSPGRASGDTPASANSASGTAKP